MGDEKRECEKELYVLLMQSGDSTLPPPPLPRKSLAFPE